MTGAAVSLSLDDARKIIAAGERKAIEIGIPYNIAVAGPGGVGITRTYGLLRG